MARAPAGAFRQRLARDQFHVEVAHALRLLQAVQGGDVWVLEGRQHLRFAVEPGQPVRVVGDIAGEDLEGDVVLKLGVSGAVHDAHVAGPDPYTPGNRPNSSPVASRSPVMASLGGRPEPTSF